jgi:hypothetical protein
MMNGASLLRTPHLKQKNIFSFPSFYILRTSPFICILVLATYAKS